MAVLKEAKVMEDFEYVVNEKLLNRFNTAEKSPKDFAVDKTEFIEDLKDVMEAFGMSFSNPKINVFYASLSDDDVKVMMSKHQDITFDPLLFADIYTEGLTRYYDHPEIGLALNIGQELVYRIFDVVLDNITTDESYMLRPGICDDILENYNVMVVEGEVTKRLYLLLPDKDGKFPNDEGCSKEYAAQINIIQYIEDVYSEREEK